MSELKSLSELEALSKDALVKYANESWGISLDQKLNKKDLIQAFKDSGGEFADGSSAKLKDSGDGLGERVEVTIHNSEGSGGGEDVVLAVNGRAILIQRGQKVSIPAAYVEVLEHATRIVVEKDESGKNRHRTVPRFAFMVHGPA